MLFLPAVSFRFAVNRLENLKGLLSTLSITDSIWVFTVVPIVIHTLMILLLTICGVTIKFDLILNIISSNKGFALNNKVLAIDIASFLGYNVTALLWGSLLGFLINVIERRKRWVSRIFGLGNEWYETFEGDILNTNTEDTNLSGIDVVYVDVLSNTKETSVLYSGVVVKYYYKPRSTELDYLVLSDVVKRDLRKEYRTDKPHFEGGKSSFYDHNSGDAVPIEGNYLIIPMKEVSNINVSYLNFSAVLNDLSKIAGPTKDSP